MGRITRVFGGAVLAVIGAGLWIVLIVSLVAKGELLISLSLALPLVAFALAYLIPGAGPGHFAVTHDFGPIPREDESPALYSLRVGRLWLLGAIALPLGLIVVRFRSDLGVPEESSLIPVLGVIFPIFGLACLLKALGCLWRSWRLRSMDANNALERTRNG
jgi:hypothetical protein